MNIPSPKPIPTIQLVALEAGVSRATVSRAFSRPEMLSPATVKLVREVALRLGYVPSQVARALSTGRHGNIALVVPDIANPFFPPMIRAVQTSADKSGMSVFLGDSDEDPAREDVLFAKLLGQVDGFILASPRLAGRRILDHRARRPLVLVNRDIKTLPRVLIDTAPGIAAAIQHLCELGHRSVAYVSGPATSWSNQQRRRAAHRSAEKHAIAIVDIPTQRATFEGAMEAAGAVLATGATAAVAFDDLMAEGLLVRLAQLGIEVPREFSVIGCDDVLGARTHPPLTTISSPSAEAGSVATGLLMELLNSSRSPAIVHTLDTRLIIRSSTAEPTRTRRSLLTR
jgi:LacI family transcriptional regulator